MDLNDNMLPPQAVRDSADALFKLVAILADGKAAKVLLADLVKKAADATTAIELAKAERVAVDDHVAAQRARLAIEAEEHAKRLAQDRDLHDQRTAEREVALSAREKRAAELEKQATEHEAKALAARKEAERRLRVMETGAA